MCAVRAIFVKIAPFYYPPPTTIRAGRVHIVEKADRALYPGIPTLASAAISSQPPNQF